MSPHSASRRGSHRCSQVGGRRGPASWLLLLTLAGALSSLAGAPIPRVSAGEPEAPREGDVLPATIEQLEPALTKRGDLAVPNGGDWVRFVYRALPRRRFTAGRWTADPEVRAVHLFFTEQDGKGGVRPASDARMAVGGHPLPEGDPAAPPRGPAPGPGVGGGIARWTATWSRWEGGTLVTFSAPSSNRVDDAPPSASAGVPDDPDPRAMPVTGVTFGLRARRRAVSPEDVPDVYTASFAFTRTNGPPDYPVRGGAGASTRPAFDLGTDAGGPNTPHWLARVARPAPPGHEIAFQLPPIEAPIEPRLVEVERAPLVLVPGGPSVALRVPRVYAGSGYRVHLSADPATLRAPEDGHGLAFDPGAPEGPTGRGLAIAPREGVFFPTQAFETVTLSRASSPAPQAPGDLWLVVEHLEAPGQRMPTDPWRIASSPPVRVFLGVSADDWDGDGAANALDSMPLDATKR